MLQRNPPITALREHAAYENILEQIRDVCVTLERRIVDMHRGVPLEEIEKLRATLRDYKKVLDVRRGKIRVAQSVLDELASRGLSLEELSEQTCFITVELLQALIAVSEYINRIDERDKNEQPIEYEDYKLGSRANLQFVDFFMKVQKECGFEPEEVFNLYKDIFYKNSLSFELQLVSLGNFPPGILAAMRAYWYLHEKKYPDAVFYVPTVSEDVDHAVDLICDNKNEDGDITEKCLFQIKGRRRAKQAKMYDISDPKQWELLMQAIQVLSDVDQHEHKAAIGRLRDYQQQLQKAAKYPIRAFWVEVIMEE